MPLGRVSSVVLGCVLAVLVSAVTGRGIALADPADGQAAPPAAVVVPSIQSSLAGFGISPQELKLFNDARQMAFRPPPAPAPGAPAGPVVMGGAAWFSKNSFEAAWGMVGKAKTPITFHLWLQGLRDAYGKDASDFEKVAVSLQLVPILGDALGLVKAGLKKDPDGIAVNLLYLVQGVLSRLGVIGVGLLVGFAAFIAWAVANGKKAVQIGSDPMDTGDMIKKRDAAWHDKIIDALQTNTVAELIGAAEKVYAQGRDNLVLNAQVALAMIDQQARETVGGGAAVAEAARAAKKQIIGHTEAMLQALRDGFVEGAHESLDTTFKKLNAGENSAEFTREYMTSQVRLTWMDFWAPGWSCNHQGLSAEDARKCVSNRPREGGYDGAYPTQGIQDAVQAHGVYSPEAEELLLAYFDNHMVPPVVANVPTDKFTTEELGDLHRRMDEQIVSTSAFKPAPVRDLAPVGPAGFVACADNGAHCGGSETPGLVAFGAAGSYVTAALPAEGVACSASSFAVNPNPSAYQTCFVPEQGGSSLPVVKTCATEGGTCRVTGTHLVAFGVGSTWVTRPVTDSIPCESTTPGFGADPAPGVDYKSCVVLAGSGPGSSPRAGQFSEPCAAENSVCYIAGRVTVAFGSHSGNTGGSWVYKTVDGADYPRGLPCTVATFGRDPFSDVAKSCVFVSAYPHFSYCAAPGGKCVVPEGARFQMAYGGDGGWVVTTVGPGEHNCERPGGLPGVSVLDSNEKNFCYLSPPDGDLVLGGEAYDVGNYGRRHSSMACAADGADCWDTGLAMWAYGKFDGITGTYLVKEATDKADTCHYGGFATQDPYLNVAQCFPLVDPGLNYDTAQTAFAFVEPAPAAPKPEPTPAPTAEPAPSPPATRTSIGGAMVEQQHRYCIESSTTDQYLRLDDCDGSDAQWWEPTDNSGLRVGDGRCLGADLSAGFAVTVPCTGGPEQAWQWGGYYLGLKDSDVCLAAPDGGKASRDHGSPLVLWECSDLRLTKWEFGRIW